MPNLFLCVLLYTFYCSVICTTVNCTKTCLISLLLSVDDVHTAADRKFVERICSQTAHLCVLVSGGAMEGRDGWPREYQSYQHRLYLLPSNKLHRSRLMPFITSVWAIQSRLVARKSSKFAMSTFPHFPVFKNFFFPDALHCTPYPHLLLFTLFADVLSMGGQLDGLFASSGNPPLVLLLLLIFHVCYGIMGTINPLSPQSNHRALRSVRGASGAEKCI